MFSIDYDARAATLHIETWGHWDMATLASFAAATVAQGTAIRQQHGEFAMLADLRRSELMTQDVATGVTALLEQSKAITMAPFALVVSTMLLKLQIARVMAAPHTRVFRDRDEAVAWLDAHWPRTAGTQAVG